MMKMTLPISFVLLHVLFISVTGFVPPPQPQSATTLSTSSSTVAIRRVGVLFLQQQQKQNLTLKQHVVVAQLGMASSSSSNDEGDNNELSTIMTQRRTFFSFALATATIPFDIYGLDQWKKSKYNTMNNNNKGIDIAGMSSSSSSPSSPSQSFIRITNVDDLVKQIETSVDRRFLHAVVASGYHQHLYASQNQVHSNDTTNMLIELEQHQEFWKKTPIEPSHCQLFVTDLDVARKRWGGSSPNDVVTVWPLMSVSSSSSSTSTSSGRNKDGGDHSSGIHYAWPEQGGNFRSSSTTSRTDIIVDGIDCGRMSLEDALEGNMEVLVQADQYLIVPLSMEEALVSRLKTSFLL
mmetsp:Transcript_18108/g.19630  ORF Transcript_18108/g.19630 Transcript_18108/m.19630 type:complete len:350 (+) Transcript_18108:70-1119(+)